MTQFEIWSFNFPRKGVHPVVLISHPDLYAQDVVNVLYCTTQKQSRGPKPFEVMLDTADGLNWETFCDCSILWSVPTAGISAKRGRVTLERRRAIRAKVRDLFLLNATD